MKTEDLDKNVETATSEMNALSKEIDSAIDEVVESNKSAKEEAVEDKSDPESKAKTDLPEGEAPPDEKEAKATKGKKVDESAQSVTITDSHIERAVKAGMSIADAKAFTSVEAFDRVCGMLEQKSASESDSADGKGDEDETDEFVSLLNGIPDLDPEDYDEKIVAGFKVMKDVIKRLSDDNKELRQSGSRQEGDWLDSQIQGLGEDYADVIGSGSKATLPAGSEQAAKRGEIERKFKALEAGYKATGEEVSRDSVFKEAVSLTLGESMAKVKTAKKEEALKSREKLIIARADGTRVTTKKDALDETAEEIDRKFFGKK